MVQNEQMTQKVRRGQPHEGMRNHYITFALSLILTALAFFAVMNPNISAGFTYMFIVLLAMVQAVLQLLFWMHMKDRGHLYARLAFIIVALILLPIFIVAIFWIWW